MPSPGDLLAVCLEAAQAGGEELLNWRGRTRPREKGPRDFVTEADLASQQAIEAVVFKYFPEHRFVGEESADQSHSSASDWAWFVDPLDGTTNYLHGLPYFAVSVAAARGGRVLAGVVLDPISGECFSAAEGGGASLGGEALRTSPAQRLEEALLAFSLPARVRAGDQELADVIRISAKCQGLRRFGAAALNLCYVAAGRLDGYWARALHAWDLAAGSLIVSEAGGKVASLGRPTIELYEPALVAAATELLFKDLLRELVSCSERQIE